LYLAAIFIIINHKLIAMKNFIRGASSALAIMFLAVFSVKAQTANVTLNVVLQNAASIVINGASTTAALTYANPADYTNGVEVDQTDAMTVVSNQPYNVSVYAADELVNGVNNIPVGDVTVTPSLSVSNTNITLTGQSIPVGSAAALDIIASTTGTASQNFNLNYSTKNAPAKDFIGKPAGTYTTTLTYTLSNP
jgi:hypothetical protein